MISSLEKTFQKIGANLKIVTSDRQRAAVLLDISNDKKGKETFEISLRKNLADAIELSVLEVKAEDRHLVLMARRFDENGGVVFKDHYLCGHDERHLFVASVEPVSTVAAAKASLKPDVIIDSEVGLNTRKRNRRKTENFKRQGEWFFVPAEIAPIENLISSNEPLVRGSGSKPHIAELAYRHGGQTVMVCPQHPNGLTHSEYKKLIQSNPKALRYRWITMRRDPTLYVKGRIKHPDHATIVLPGWHRVLMNTERHNHHVAFLD